MSVVAAHLLTKNRSSELTDPVSTKSDWRGLVGSSGDWAGLRPASDGIFEVRLDPAVQMMDLVSLSWSTMRWKKKRWEMRGNRKKFGRDHDVKFLFLPHLLRDLDITKLRHFLHP